MADKRSPRFIIYEALEVYVQRTVTDPQRTVRRRKIIIKERLASPEKQSGYA